MYYYDIWHIYISLKMFIISVLSWRGADTGGQRGHWSQFSPPLSGTLSECMWLGLLLLILLSLSPFLPP